ncbi:MAG: amidohydrolase family protein, partial [Bacteroidetes bacterium]|nr:amidohydrolase family protein [Bacteroidota bacterium]
MSKTIHLLALILVFSSFVRAQNYKAITHANIIRTDKEKIISNTNLLIKDNKIEKIGKNIVIPEQAEIIDGSGKYLIPGLVDAHIHFFQSGGLYTRPDGLDLTHRKSYEDEMAWIKANIDDVFKRYIRCGITSVIDMGGPMWNFDVKKYSKEAPVAPRVYLSGPLIASYQPDVLTTDDPPIIKVNTVEEALKLVDKQIAMNTDFIKIWYVITAGMTGEVFEPIVKAIIEESHKRGKPVYVHALELDKSAKRAMRAGADVLVHSIRDQAIDEDFLKLAKQNNVSYIPTLWVLESYASVYSKQLDLLPIEHQAGNPYIIGSLYDMHEIPADELPERVNKMHHDHTPIKTSDIILQNLKKVQEAGINVVAGTDAGNVGVYVKRMT